MTDHPIIFSAPMVLALLAGRKTMTRRLADQEQHYRMNGALEVRCKRSERTHSIIEPSPWQRVQPGDRLWVRENFWACGFWQQTGSSMNPRYSFVRDASHAIAFDADSDMRTFEKGKFAQAEPAWHHRPNIFLPREESRLTLTVTATKIERLQEISEENAIAEGAEIVPMRRSFVDGGVMVYGEEPHVYDTPRAWFRKLWCSLHGDGAWDENPEVVALSFTVHKQNIDALAEAA